MYPPLLQVGCAAGSFCSGVAADKLGRRMSSILGAGLYTLGEKAKILYIYTQMRQSLIFSWLWRIVLSPDALFVLTAAPNGVGNAA